MEELIPALCQRINEGIKNPDTLDMETVKRVSSEVIDMTQGRELPLYLLLDIGMYRFKVGKKMSITDHETQIYKDALKEVKKYPLPTNKQTENRPCFVRDRMSQWGNI